MASLARVRSASGVVWLQSTLLTAVGVVHGFSTRRGGVSRGPFASLNLAGLRSTGGEDEAAALIENRRRFSEAIGLGTLPVATVRQVHGATVASAEACVGASMPNDGADALVGGPGGQTACMIRVADCVPILVAEETGEVVAAIHAGWRGVVAGIVAAAIDELRRKSGASTPRFVAAIGPCAGVHAFEVGEEVAAAFAAVGLETAVQRRSEWSRPHVDLFDAVRKQLVSAGVDAGAIDGEPTCTMAAPKDFFSHRRDRGTTGRMAAAIAARDDA